MVPPLDRLPASVTEQAVVDALLVLESAAPGGTVASAYQTALQRWPDSFVLLMGLVWTLTLRGRSQCGDDSILHLRSRLARKRDGNDLFGFVHDGQQAQIALDQKLCFSRSRRRLHDERTFHLEGIVTRGRVVCKKAIVTAHCAAP